MRVNLRCSVCGSIYDYEVGEPSMDDNYRLVFEKKPICPQCKAIDKELLTEKGQGQMTDWDLRNM